jgi:hypothetical protein
LEKRRASASLEVHSKQYVRHKEALARVVKFQEDYGDRGAAVIRYEWRCWKRIIQTDPKHRWRLVHHSAQTVIRRVYREDDKAAADWSLVCSREATVRPVVRDEVDGKTALLHEYLVSVLKRDGHYSISSITTRPKDDGTGLERVTSTSYFVFIRDGARQPPAKGVAHLCFC